MSITTTVANASTRALLQFCQRRAVDANRLLADPSVSPGTTPAAYRNPRA